MKLLILVRHAHALGSFTSNVNSDAERPLSEQGLDKARQTAFEIEQLGCKPQLLLTSPVLRARQTADILGERLNIAVTPQEELNGYHSDRDVCRFLAERMKEHDCVIAVGHNPNISLVARLLSKTDRGFGPGSFMVMNFDNPHKPELVHFGE